MKMSGFIILGMLVLSIGIVAGLPTNYFVVEKGYPKVSPVGVVKIGNPIAIDLVLEKQGVVPQEAILNLTLDIANPIVYITYDSKTEIFRKRQIELNIPNSTKLVKISLRGNAPKVSSLTEIDVLSTKMYVYYDPENNGYINISNGTVRLNVTDVLISQALSEISIAESKLSKAENLVKGLESRGVNTTSLNSRLKVAAESINIAKEEQASGAVDMASSNAMQATVLLNGIITQAQKQNVSVVKTSTYKKDILIGVGIVIVLVIVVLLLRAKRDELG